MAGNQIAWFCPELEPEELAAACKKALKRQGFKKIVSRRSKGNILIGGIFGSTLMALVIRLLPFGNWLPWGNRYRAEMKVGIYQEKTRLRMKVFPVMELFDHKEIFLLSQDLGEAMADSIHSKRLGNKLQEDIETQVGTMEPLFTASELKKRGRKLGRRRR